MMILPKSVAYGTFALASHPRGAHLVPVPAALQRQQGIAGYSMGRAAERARNPASGYIDSGAAFCYDGAEFHRVKRTSKSVFRVKK